MLYIASLNIDIYITFPLHPSTISPTYASLDVKMTEEMQTFEDGVIVGAMGYASPIRLSTFIND